MDFKSSTSRSTCLNSRRDIVGGGASWNNNVDIMTETSSSSSTSSSLTIRQRCQRPPRLFSTMIIVSMFLMLHITNGFLISSPRSYAFVGVINNNDNVPLRQQHQQPPQQFTPGRRSCRNSCRLWVFAPPGSGYAAPEDETSLLPSTYEPMMEYPGTMRPGRTPENMPFHDLPIADSDPDPVPWPHFQQIEWHHKWEPPHEHPTPMEDYIAQAGRWATPEMEAAMRAGVRRGVREQREWAESEKRDTIITDDDEEDDFFAGGAGAGPLLDIPIALGDGIFGQLGSTADQAATAAATAPGRASDKAGSAGVVDVEADVVEDEYDDSFDDFLLDLGLDSDLDEDGRLMENNKSTKKKESKKEQPPKAAAASSREDDGFFAEFNEEEDDEEDEGAVISVNRKKGSVTASISVDDDSDLDLGLDDEDDLEVDTVPLEDFGDNDNPETEDFFDEGGFDFEDGGFDMDGGDMW